ncbi:hypothetical protein [Leekyejoonella antrihumi]|uniref:Uncharacterized protein n=1 Tax=Leekyejoonella antrihumi TaxID=1660198 RepID=A0A563DQU5_9MICO|nr:hypothetical protein [Leekyejoonella antrihumi]TWP32313.1 hypothetical protein FGL98_24455 [Leekyejoonella antrihumi]
MSAEPDVLPPLHAITADHELYTIVRDWTRDSIRPVPVPANWKGAGATLMVKTPGPWASVVAFGVRNEHELSPLLVLKNAIALWAVHRDLPDGIIDSADWTWLRHLCLLHNPGLDGALTVIGQAVR